MVQNHAKNILIFFPPILKFKSRNTENINKILRTSYFSLLFWKSTSKLAYRQKFQEFCIERFECFIFGHKQKKNHVAVPKIESFLKIYLKIFLVENGNNFFWYSMRKEM